MVKATAKNGKDPPEAESDWEWTNSLQSQSDKSESIGDNKKYSVAINHMIGLNSN